MARKFKLGDKVKITKCIEQTGEYGHYIGTVSTIDHVSTMEGQYPYSLANVDAFWGDNELELFKGGTMARRTFRVIKDTPELKKGAIIQEACDDGTQDYVSLNKSDLKFNDQRGIAYTRKVVESQPTFFVEVFPLVAPWGTKEEVAKVKKLLRSK